MERNPTSHAVWRQADHNFDEHSMLEGGLRPLPQEAGKVTILHETEADLVAAFLATQGSGNGFPRLLHEFETLAGVPDVVLLDMPSAETSDEVGAELLVTKMATNGQASVLSCLHPKAARHIERIAQATGLAPNYVRRIVTDLRSLSLVETMPSGAVRLSTSYQVPRVRFTALEFKLSDWRRALAQALRHRSFAAVTVVVMPVKREAALQAASAVFREYGVGSAVFDRNKMKLRYIVKPRVRTPTSRRVYLDAVGRAAVRDELSAE